MGFLFYVVAAITLFAFYTYLIKPLLQVFFYYRQGLTMPLGYIPVIGHHLQLSWSMKNKHDMYWFVRKHHPKNKGITPWVQGMKTIIQIGDPETIFRLLQTQSWDKYKEFEQFSDFFGGKDYIFARQNTVDGIQHKSFVKTVFNKEVSESLADLYLKYTMEHLEELDSLKDSQLENVDLFQKLLEISTKVANKTILGSQINSNVEYYDWDGKLKKGLLGELFMVVIVPSIERYYLRRNFMGAASAWGITQRDRIINANSQILTKAFRDIVESRFSQPLEEKPNDLFGLALKRAKETNYAITSEEMLNLLSVANGITTHGIATIVYCMLAHLLNDPNLYNQVQDEIKRYFEEQSEITVDSFKSLTFTDYCIRETLRLNTPILFLPELSLKENVNLGNITLHKDSLVLIDIAYCQTREEAWFSPKDFMPCRWDINSPYYKTPSGQKRHQLDWMPFFFGTRGCPGQNITWLGVRCFFVILHKKFTVDKVEKSEEHLETTKIMYYPKAGITLKKNQNAH